MMVVVGGRGDGSGSDYNDDSDGGDMISFC